MVLTIYKKIVTVDGHQFKIIINNKYNILVVRDEFKEVLVKGFWYDRVSGTAIWGDVENPRRVMMAILEEIVTAIKITKVPYFTFSAMENHRFSLYKRLAPIIEEKTGYTCMIYEEFNKFTFVKEKAT
jgi:hypothetical protein